MNYFIQEHFDLFEKWQGNKGIPNESEQEEAKTELKAAYEVIENWANGLILNCINI